MSLLILVLSGILTACFLLYGMRLSGIRAQQNKTVTEPVGIISCPCHLELSDENHAASSLALISPSGQTYMADQDTGTVSIDTLEAGLWQAQYLIKNEERAQLSFHSKPSMSLMITDISLDWNETDPVLKFNTVYGDDTITGFRIKCFVSLESSNRRLDTVWQGVLDVNAPAELHLDLSGLDTGEEYRLLLTTYNADDLQDESMRTSYRHERSLSYGSTGSSD